MEQLGIEPLQLATQAFNFVVMIGILTYLLYKPILKGLKARRDKIAEGLAFTEKAKAELEKTEAKRQHVLAEAKEEAGAIVEEAKKSGKLLEADIVAKAQEEAKLIVEKAKSDSEVARADMEKKVREEMIDLASAIAAKTLEGTISAKEHRAIIDKKIRMIAKELS